MVVVGDGGGEEASDEVPVFQVVEEMPEFPGGMGAVSYTHLFS